MFLELAPGERAPSGKFICCPVVCLPSPWFGQGALEPLELPTGWGGDCHSQELLPHWGRHKGDGHTLHMASDPRDDAMTPHCTSALAQMGQEGDAQRSRERAAQRFGPPRPRPGALLCTLYSQTIKSQRQRVSAF